MILDAGCAHRDHGSDVGFLIGAGDENRTRTISLGICTIHAPTRPDLRIVLSASDREIPLFTGANGPLMARRSWADLRLRAPRPPDHPGLSSGAHAGVPRPEAAVDGSGHRRRRSRKARLACEAALGSSTDPRSTTAITASTMSLLTERSST